MRNFEEKDYEKHFNGIKPEYIHKLIRVIQALIPDVKIILYGSRARGDATNRSDIDIALDAGKEISGDIFIEIYEVVKTLTIFNSIDLVDLAHTRGSFREAILRDGIYLN